MHHQFLERLTCKNTACIFFPARLCCFSKSIHGRFGEYLGTDLLERFVVSKFPTNQPHVIFWRGTIKQNLQIKPHTIVERLKERLLCVRFEVFTFLRNVGSHRIYTAPHPRRRPSSRLLWSPRISAEVSTEVTGMRAGKHRLCLASGVTCVRR
jgi:hypothetical protein